MWKGRWWFYFHGLKHFLTYDFAYVIEYLMVHKNTEEEVWHKRHVTINRVNIKNNKIKTKYVCNHGWSIAGLVSAFGANMTMNIELAWPTGQISFILFTLYACKAWWNTPAFQYMPMHLCMCCVLDTIFSMSVVKQLSAVLLSISTYMYSISNAYRYRLDMLDYTSTIGCYNVVVI